ncbi:MAG: cation diffusion facilitator family transporter [Parvularculales bacterium]
MTSYPASPANSVSSEKAAILMRRATVLAILVACCLITFKALAWWFSDSVAILASLLDSGLDMAASVVNLVAVRHALTPADEEHRFGHGKAEAMAGLGQSLLVALSAIWIIGEATERLLNPHPVVYPGLALGVMGVSTLATLGLVLYQRHVIRLTRSLAIGADHLHYMSDFMVNIAVIVSIVLSVWFGLTLVDPFFGLVIAFIIIWGAWRIISQSWDELMDRELPDDDRAQIKSLVLGHGDVKGLHDLRTRSAGQRQFIQFHIELVPDLSILEAHQISDEVEERVMAAYPKAEVLIHQDPLGVEHISGLEKV